MKKTSFPTESPKRKRALKLARARAAAAEKWYADGNKLMPQTMPEFQRLMKETDRETKLLLDKNL